MSLLSDQRGGVTLFEMLMVMILLSILVVMIPILTPGCRTWISWGVTVVSLAPVRPTDMLTELRDNTCRRGSEMRNLLRDQRGVLTLLERLAVMTVLSILVVMVLPGLDSLVKEAKVHVIVQDIQMKRLALLMFNVHMGVWPADNHDDPADGLSDVDLMGGNCGASGTTEAFPTNDPGIFCQGHHGGTAQVALFPTEDSPTFRIVPYTPGMSIKWQGPFLSRENKAHPFGGSVVLDLDTNLINLPDERFLTMNAGANDVILLFTKVPLEAQLRIDTALDDGNRSTGFVRGSGDTLQVVVSAY
jgi:competence protein ComGC